MQKDTAHCAGIFFNPENTEILYKSHFAKCGYEVIIFISICFLLLPSYADANGYITSEEELIRFGDAIWEELFKEYGVKPTFERRCI